MYVRKSIHYLLHVQFVRILNEYFLRSLTTARPRFTTRPTDQNVQIGSDFVLNCNGNGEPMPFITWTFNGEELNETKGGHVIRFSVLNNGKSLKIYNFSTDLVGQYGCSIFNEYGSKYAEATVTRELARELLNYKDVNS